MQEVPWWCQDYHSLATSPLIGGRGKVLEPPDVRRVAGGKGPLPRDISGMVSALWSGHEIMSLHSVWISQG